MAASASTDPGDFDLEALIQSLPACKRCRDCRRGCDTLLPKCRQCTKAGVECMFLDHGRNEFLPRTYIAELVDHVRRLSQGNASVAPGQFKGSKHAVARQRAESAATESVNHYEHHFAFAGDSYRYLGAESCLLKSPHVEPRNIPSPFIAEEDDAEWQLSWKQSEAKQFELLQLYLEIIQPVYPILDPNLRYLARDVPANLEPTESFSLNMLYSISCYILPNTGKRQSDGHVWNPSGRLSYHQANSMKYRALANRYFQTAMKHLEAATIEPDIATLRAVILLAINGCFEPRAGNVGQQIALAGRLAMNLEAKAELQELDPKDIEMLRGMHLTIYSLENQIASTLDRPALFPEPNIPLSFDKSKPAEFMASLFRLQNRFRRGDYMAKQNVKKQLPMLDEKAELLPIVRISLHMTHLFCNPCWGSAWHVLEAVVSLGGVHVFITPQWVYRAGTVLIHNIPQIFGGNLIQLYSNALLVLELSSWKWPSSAALSASLVDLMQRMKTKYRPDWADTLQLGDMHPGLNTHAAAVSNVASASRSLLPVPAAATENNKHTAAESGD